LVTKEAQLGDRHQIEEDRVIGAYPLPFLLLRRTTVERNKIEDKRHTSGYDYTMKPINWNTEKNISLKSERGVSFEEVLAAMSHGALLDVVSHPNIELYPNQRIYIVRIRGYAYLVPFVETDKEIFLKTIIPSRIATKKYLLEEINHEN
jgi:uncharacterized DUF497 family protein